MNLFYVPDVNTDSLTLEREESRHIIRVLRMCANDLLHLTNGKGSILECRITLPDAEGVGLTICDKRFVERPSPSIHIAIAPTKYLDRFEWFLEKATEIGVNRITPVICEHSERRTLKSERLHRVLIAAMKQSLHAWLPELDEPLDLKKFMAQKQRSNLFLGSAHSETHFKSACKAGDDALFIVGPEGDLSPGELELLKSSGAIPVNLGSSRLRTETAGVSAVSCFRFVNH